MLTSGQPTLASSLWQASAREGTISARRREVARSSYHLRKRTIRKVSMRAVIIIHHSLMVVNRWKQQVDARLCFRFGRPGETRQSSLAPSQVYHALARQFIHQSIDRYSRLIVIGSLAPSSYRRARESGLQTSPVLAPLSSAKLRSPELGSKMAAS